MGSALRACYCCCLLPLIASVVVYPLFTSLVISRRGNLKRPLYLHSTAVRDSHVDDVIGKHTYVPFFLFIQQIALGTCLTYMLCYMDYFSQEPILTDIHGSRCGMCPTPVPKHRNPLNFIIFEGEKAYLS